MGGMGGMMYNRPNNITPMQSSSSLIDQTPRTITNSLTGQTHTVLANDPRLQGMTDDEIFSQYLTRPGTPTTGATTTPPSDLSDDYYTKNIMGSSIANIGNV